MIISTVANNYAVVRSFGSSSILGWPEKSNVITKSFECYSEFRSRNESTWEEISIKELEEPLNILSAGRRDN